MPYQIENMTKTEFDGFINFLEILDFTLPYPDSEEGRKLAGQFSMVHRLTENADYAAVYAEYCRYRTVRDSESSGILAKEYKIKLNNLREQCA